MVTYVPWMLASIIDTLNILAELCWTIIIFLICMTDHAFAHDSHAPTKLLVFILTTVTWLPAMIYWVFCKYGVDCRASEGNIWNNSRKKEKSYSVICDNADNGGFNVFRLEFHNFKQLCEKSAKQPSAIYWCWWI